MNKFNEQQTAFIESVADYITFNLERRLELLKMGNDYAIRWAKIWQSGLIPANSSKEEAIAAIYKLMAPAQFEHGKN